MRSSSLGFLVAIVGLATISVATPSGAASGGLQGLVGYGAQDVYLPPAAEAPASASPTEAPPGATGASADTPATPADVRQAPANAPEANGQDDAGRAAVHQKRQPKQLRLSKDCRSAGLKTREECDALRTAKANKPADAVLPADSESSAGAATVDSAEPGSASIGEAPAASAEGPPAVRIMNGMGGAAFSN